MEKPFSFKKFKVSSFVSVVLIIGLAILMMLPVFLYGFPAGADFDNHFRFALPFYDEIGKGNFVPGWLAESNYGFGDARFRFYPPLLYYVLCFFRYLLNDWYYAALSTFTFFSIIGSLGVYFWSRQNLSGKIAVLAAVLFTLSPYHLTQFYQASLLAEFAAASLLPFCFLFIDKILTEKAENRSTQFFNVGGLAISYSLIIVTHLPTTVIGSFCLGLFALFICDWKNNKKSLIFCGLGFGLGALSSCWFLIKMVSELGWIQAGEKVNSPYYDYHNNFVFSPFSLTNLNTFYGSLLFALTVGIFLPVFIILRQIFRNNSSGGEQNQNQISEYFSKEKYPAKPGRTLLAILIIFLFSLLMTTDLSRPIWATIPKFRDVQFPYRWLSIASIMVCPLAALSLPIWYQKIRQKNIRLIQIPLIIGFLFALFYTIQNMVLGADLISREDFLERIEERRGARSFADWLPPGASEIKDLAPINGQVDAGTRKVSVTQWDSHQRIFHVEAGDTAEARIKSYYYPLWQAFILRGGEKVSVSTEKAADGTLLISIPPEAADIELAFTEPPRTKISFIIAAFSWTISLALLIIGFVKKRTSKN